MNPNRDALKAADNAERVVARRSVARTEVMTLSLVILPFVVLAGCLIIDALESTIAKANIRTYVAQQIAAGHPVDRRALASRYDNQTSKAATAAWATLLEASRPLQDSPSIGLRYGDDRIVPTAIRANETSVARQGEMSLPVVDFIVQRDAALTRAREALLNRDRPSADNKSVWLPVAFWRDYPQALTGRSEFYEDDTQAFYSAIADGENDHAIHVLHRLIRTDIELDSQIWSVNSAAAKRPPETVIHLIRQSLAVADWNEDQLATLRKMIERVPDYQAVIDQHMRVIMAASLDEMGLSDGVVANKVFRENSRSLPVKISPQAAWQWIQFMERARQTGQPGTWSRYLSLRREPWYDQRRPGLDTVSMTSFPYASGTFLIGSTPIYRHLTYDTHASYESNRRLALTAIGIKQYHQQKNAWPQSLADLRAVGLTSEDWQIMPGVEFGYQNRPLQPRTSVGSEVVLWTAKLKDGHLDQAIERFARGDESASPPVENYSKKFDMQRITLIRE
ncbi:hypothetical protein RMSM_02346 [Rhodopirellula maiorica SM1]|uniref:Uncharacterized protein n=1 Tax=Rhodopirellula maiorica SM1 TaxID=1265738 RepID=M5RN28_9BACT|nr:hypothetical protein [Rhodopirellula maiorica]EMI20733.1 hypothetical protein RMSM_02346 [Rhodopirellula maiorica SM1]